jgi:hypothetical protein
MKKLAARKKAPPVSDQAVQAKTGKNWEQWFRVLDRAGAKKMNHTDIAAYLYHELECPGWWNQMVAVGYEQARGLRRKHETPAGFQISCSKTVPVPLSTLFAAWWDERSRLRWLKERGMVVRKATRDKSVRVTWVDGRTTLEVLFYAKGEAKSQVTLQHNKLADADAAERMKIYWSDKLEQLRAFLLSGES